MLDVSGQQYRLNNFAIAFIILRVADILENSIGGQQRTGTYIPDVRNQTAHPQMRRSEFMMNVAILQSYGLFLSMRKVLAMAEQK
jgi:hypothetical protein